MDYEDIKNAVRICGSTPDVDLCAQDCPYYAGSDTRDCIPRMTEDAAKAITALLARAEAAEARAEKAERERDALDRLRELVEISKEIPHTCCFCIGCEIEPNDGHGCDDYDSFVFSPRRLRDLVEADKDGRCVVLPKDGMLYFLEESIDSGEKWVGNWPVKDVFFKCGFGIASLSYSIQDIGSKIYLTREAAEAALKGEQDGNMV